MGLLVGASVVGLGEGATVGLLVVAVGVSVDRISATPDGCGLAFGFGEESTPYDLFIRCCVGKATRSG